MTDILIIEDNPELGILVRDHLRKNGYTAELCHDAESGLELLEREEFRLILLDVMLPNMNGFETCTAVREKWEIPILMMSAQTDEQSKLMGYETGADDYRQAVFNINSSGENKSSYPQEQPAAEKQRCYIGIRSYC